MPTATAPPTSTDIATASEPDLLPGYYVEESTGAWLTLPRFPLGEIPTIGLDVVHWAEEGDGRRWYGLVNHITGDPWRFTKGQLNFLLWWYAIDAERRKWLYRSGVRRGAKGTGKDPLLATMALAELCGPVRPVERDGRWVGESYRLSLVQIGANSEAQAKEPLAVANAMVDAAMSGIYGFDKGILRTQLESGSKIETLTSSEKSSEGDPATAIFLNESHHMTEASGGAALAAVTRRNVGKSPGGWARVLEFTNAHQSGGDSVAEHSFEAWQAQAAGRAGRTDILYDSTEAPPGTNLYDDASRSRGLRAAYYDAPWVDLDRIESEMLDSRTSVADSVRYYLNGLATAEDAWIDPRAFDECVRPETIVAERERIALFLDCSKSGDATGLVGSRLSDGYVMTLGVWQRPHGARGEGWLAPRLEVDAVVRDVFGRYEVVWLGVDPSPARDDEDEALYWMPLIDEWHRDFGKTIPVWTVPGRHSVLFDMRMSQPGGADRNRLFTEAAMQTAREIDDEKSLSHDGHPALRLHAHNARRRPNQWGVTLGKINRTSAKLVDLAVCMVGARLGRRLALNSSKLGRRKTGRAAF